MLLKGAPREGASAAKENTAASCSLGADNGGRIADGQRRLPRMSEVPLQGVVLSVPLPKEIGRLASRSCSRLGLRGLLVDGRT